MLQKYYKKLYGFIKPKSTNEDKRRREFILNTLLVTSIIFTIIGNSILALNILTKNTKIDPHIANENLLKYLSILIFFLFLYYLSRKGKIALASFLLIVSYFIPTTLMAYQWGIALPASLLGYTVIIVMSGVLINSRFAIFIALTISTSMLSLSFLQGKHIIEPDLYWTQERVPADDVIVYTAIFIVISVISWLSNREIDKSLVRARKSETELKQERDQLEITVQKRTEAWQKAEMEKMAHVSRFAEFGRLSAGMFHDLMNPLTSISLNLEHINKEHSPHITDAKSHVTQAIRATKHLENFITAVRKQMTHTYEYSVFTPAEEITQVLDILDYKARKAQVKIFSFIDEKIQTYGNSIGFNQVITNLVSNAIETYKNKTDSKKCEVIIQLFMQENIIFCTVQDWGGGIKKEHLSEIFKPFFTTKGSNKGMGIGLASAQGIIERDFHGTIVAHTAYPQGSTFMVRFPHYKNKEDYAERTTQYTNQ